MDRALSPRNIAGIDYAQSIEARDELSAQLCELADCEESRKLVVATQEVRIRLRLDDRY